MIYQLYTTGITRKPGRNFSQGISTAGLGAPDYERALVQHASYVAALRHCGLAVIELEADERYPDGCFVEDTAVVVPEVAIITHPGAPSRNGEQRSIEDLLRRYRGVERILPPGTLDGGDVLRIEKEFFVGSSARTNGEGFSQFEQIVKRFGYTATSLTVPDLLHLKSGVAYIGGNMLVAVQQLADRPEFFGHTMLPVGDEEAYGANCLRVGEHTLFVSADCPALAKLLGGRGYDVVTLEMSEFRKMDGGLTCLSLLF